MAACHCWVCGGPVAPDSDLERLDLFDLRLAGGHLAASAVQRLRPLQPATGQARLCADCAAQLARQQRLLTRRQLIDAETELDDWVAGLLPEAAGLTSGDVGKPASAPVRAGDGSEVAAQGGGSSQTENQTDGVTDSAEARPNGTVDSSQARPNGAVKSAADFQLQSGAVRCVGGQVRSEGVEVRTYSRPQPDSAAVKVKGPITVEIQAHAETDWAVVTLKGVSDSAVTSAAVQVTADNRARQDSQPTRFRCDVCGVNLKNVILLLRHFHLHSAADCSHTGMFCTAAAANGTNGSGPTCSRSNRFRCAICDVSIGDMALLLGHLDRHLLHASHNGTNSARRKSPEKPRTQLVGCDAVMLTSTLPPPPPPLPPPTSSSSPSPPSPSPSSPPPPPPRPPPPSPPASPPASPPPRPPPPSPPASSSSSSSSCTNVGAGTRETSLALPMCVDTSETGQFQLQRQQVAPALPKPSLLNKVTPKASLKRYLNEAGDEMPLKKPVSSAELYCKACHVAVKDRRALTLHRWKCEARKFVCPHCDHRFPNQYKLKRHMVSHTGGFRACCCHLCPASFDDITQLKQHMGYHDADTDVQCRLCPARFIRGRARSIAMHMAYVHGQLGVSAAPAGEGQPRSEAGDVASSAAPAGEGQPRSEL